jgi:DNA repair protein RadC
MPFASKPILSRYSEVIAHLQWTIGMKDVEEMRALFLDAANHLLADKVLSTGTVNHVPVYTREVVEHCLAAHATAVILAHNHPSGKVEPSEEDIEMTNKVHKSVSLVGITLHDHIIVGKGRWYSFKNSGILASFSAGPYP